MTVSIASRSLSSGAHPRDPLDRNREPSPRLRHNPDIRPWRFPALRIDGFGLVVADRACDDDVLALFPVGRRRDAMLGGHLQRIDRAQDFLEIAARGHGVDHDKLYLLVRPDDEDVADGLVVGRGARGGIARGRGRQHVVQLRYLEIGVADHRIIRRRTLRLLDVFRPFRVLVDGIDAKPHQLDAALVEFRLQLRERAELGGADRREILRVREQKRPAVADPVMEFDLAFGGFSVEIRGYCAYLESHDTTSCHSSYRGIRLFEYTGRSRLSEWASKKG